MTENSGIGAREGIWVSEVTLGSQGIVLEGLYLVGQNDVLRTVPTFVAAHKFCASRDTRVSYGWCLLIQGYFARFKTMRRKQNLASAFRIQKENWGLPCIFQR